MYDFLSVRVVQATIILTVGTAQLCVYCCRTVFLTSAKNPAVSMWPETSGPTNERPKKVVLPVSQRAFSNFVAFAPDSQIIERLF